MPQMRSFLFPLKTKIIFSGRRQNVHPKLSVLGVEKAKNLENENYF